MNKLLFTFLAAATMVGCTESDSLMPFTSDNVVNFSSESIGTRTTTDADGYDLWEKGDAIGIYSVGFDSDYHNVKYLTQADGASTTFEAENDVILFPHVESGTVSFYAYYPFSTLDENYIKVDISNQKGDYNAVDFMIAESKDVSYGADNNTNNVVFEFDHRLSKIVINVECNDNITSLEGLTASLSNIYTQVSYNYKDDEIINGTTNTIDLTVIENETAVDEGEVDEVEVITATIVAILMPGDYTISSVLTLSLDGEDYTVGFATSLTEGYSHTFDIALGNEITGFETGNTIGDWETDGEMANIRPEKQPDIDITIVDDAYQVNTALGLQAIAALINGDAEPENLNTENEATKSEDTYFEFGKPHPDINIVLATNIDLSTICYDQSTSWTPIGNRENPYSGEFDGGGFEISGLYINTTSDNNQGLFGYINKATIINLGVDGEVTGYAEVGGLVGNALSSTITDCYSTCTVTACTTITNFNYAGGLVGSASSSTITSCYNSGEVICSQAGFIAYIGGVVGYIAASTIVTDCYNSGEVTTESYSTIGGVVGYIASSSAVITCYNEGEVTAKQSSTNIGGVAGVNYESTITSCYSYGSVSSASSSNYIGGVLGYNYGTISYCCYDNETVNDSEDYSAIGVDYGTTDFVEGYSTEDMQSEDMVTLLNNGAYLYNLESETKVGAWTYVNGGYPILNWQATE